MFDQLVLTLAQEDAPPSSLPSGPISNGEVSNTQQPTNSPDQASQPMSPILFIIPAALVLMMIFSMTGQRKEKKKREKMLSNLKKSDKVQTVGGIIATTIEVRDDYVVLKIDENTNTRVKITRSAIQSVLPDKDE